MPEARDVALEDWVVASRRIPGGAQGIRELAAIMATEGPRLLEEMRRGLAEQDPERVRLGAHTLRGSAQHFHADDVVAAASDVEALAREKDLAGISGLLPDMARLVAALTAELTAVDTVDLERILANDSENPSS